MSRAEGNPKPQYAGIPADKKTAAYSKAYYEKNKEQRQAEGREYNKRKRREDPEKARKRASEYWHAKPKEERSRICDSRRFKDRFKRTTEWYDESLMAQDGHCALCDFVPTEKRLNVDHDHKCCDRRITCGQCVRGLLCDQCNFDLGFLEKFLSEISSHLVIPFAGTWTFRAVEYLRKYQVLTQERQGAQEKTQK